MSRDFDHIIKEISKNNKDIHQIDNKISKDIQSIDRDVSSIKKEIALVRSEVDNISNKIDLILEILNNFTLMVMEEEENSDESESFLNEYDSEGDWVPDPDWSDDDDN